MGSLAKKVAVTVFAVIAAVTGVVLVQDENSVPTPAHVGGQQSAGTLPTTAVQSDNTHESVTSEIAAAQRQQIIDDPPVIEPPTGTQTPTDTTPPTTGGGRRRAVQHPSPLPRPTRTGYAFPVMYDLGAYRVNVYIVANNDIPEPVWSDVNFRDVIGAQGNLFRVHIWRIRGSRADRVATVDLDAKPSGFAHYPLGWEFQKGDLAVVEWNPGIQTRRDQASGMSLLPLASVIDNQSGDPTTMFSARIEF